MDSTADATFAGLRPDPQGLVVAVVQHADDGRVLMVGYMNAEALAATLARRRVVFFSRSRQRLWEKGESSGHTLELEEVRVDCDADALLIRARPQGPTCHTGAASCFHRRIGEPAAQWPVDDGPHAPPGTALDRLAHTIVERRDGRGLTNAEGRSWVRTLLERGMETVGAKVREEADELARALVGETDERVAAEMADLLFHALVGLVGRGLSLADVAAVLQARENLSGVDEKSAR